MRRYLAGAVCMGFGGMLAGGCAVGAGVSGAGLTDRLIDRGEPLGSTTQAAAPVGEHLPQP